MAKKYIITYIHPRTNRLKKQLTIGCSKENAKNKFKSYHKKCIIKGVKLNGKEKN